MIILSQFANMKNGDAFVVWLTGLPGSGKTTIALLLAEKLRQEGLKVEVLDGDEVRKNLSPDLGFSRQDRETHAKRVAYVSHLLARNGIVVIVALISPFRASREYARSLIGKENFIEVWAKCPIEICKKRDPKGLYKKAEEGKINNLTGLQDPYEPPLSPDIVVDTEKEDANSCVNNILSKMNEFHLV